jgi:glycosyltransferase involved in cell wall biosynthesis
MAHSAKEMNFDVWILGMSPTGERTSFIDGGIHVELLPFSIRKDATEASKLRFGERPKRILRRFSRALKSRIKRSSKVLARMVPTSVTHRSEAKIAMTRYERWASAVGDFINTNLPEVLHLHDALSPTVLHFLDDSVIANINVVYDAHEWVEGLAAESDRPIWNFAMTLEQDAMRRCSKVVTVSSELANKLLERYAVENVHVVKNYPYVPSQNGFGRRGGANDVRNRFGLSQSSFVIVYQGVVKPERGLRQVIPVLTHDPELHLVILCNRNLPHVSEIVEYASECGVQNQLHIGPYVPSAHLVEFISSADVGIHPIQPSNNAGIALPNKFFEFLAANLPIIVTLIGGKMEMEVKEKGLGECFVNGNTKDLFRAIEMIRNNRGEYVRNVVRYSEEISWDSQKSTMWELWRMDPKATMPDLTLGFSYPELEGYAEF